MAETGGLVANSREAPRLGAQHEGRPLRPVVLVGLRLARQRLFQIGCAPIAPAGCASHNRWPEGTPCMGSLSPICATRALRVDLGDW